LLARGNSLSEIIPKFEGIEKGISGKYYYRKDIGTFESIEKKTSFMNSLLKN